MTAVAALSPLYHASPHSFLAEQNNQRVPGSPGLSPFFGRLPRARSVLSSPNSNSPVAHVPEAGSPLLRQILRAGRKRQREGSPSPTRASASASKRSRGSPRVPNSVIIVQRKASQNAAKTPSQEQVVPSCNPPAPTGDKPGIAGSSSGEVEESCQRKLSESKEGVKFLELFSGDDIFAHHEE